MICALGSVSMASAIVKKPKTKSKLSTEVDFNDRVVGGKYQYSTEAVTTVENEKIIDDLIGVRKNFDDRIKRTKEMR
jgi:hypothetical protein